MSATARNYVYMVQQSEKGHKKPEPTISAEKMKEYRQNVEKYLIKRDGRGTHRTV